MQPPPSDAQTGGALASTEPSPRERASASGFVEWHLGGGALPLVLSAPHGGKLAPADIPDRTTGSKVSDLQSLELARAVRESFPEGARPGLVGSLLLRRKLDPNRPRAEAADGNAQAEAAWGAYHAALEEELRASVRAFGFALLLDLHGQSHRSATELGYLLTSEDLRLPDWELEGKVTSLSALRRLSGEQPPPLAELLRGGASLGGLLEQRGFACTPSPSRPQPVTEEALAAAAAEGLPPPRYFPGNYAARRYGAPEEVPKDDDPLPLEEVSAWASHVSAVQVETERLAREASHREAFAVALRDAVLEFLASHTGWRPGVEGCPKLRPPSGGGS